MEEGIREEENSNLQWKKKRAINLKKKKEKKSRSVNRQI